MSEDTIQAIAMLQARCLAYQYRNPYWNQRFERALDDLVRNPHRVGPPKKLAANAVANAGKDLTRRNQIVALTLESNLPRQEDDSPVLLDELAFDGAWVDRSEHLRIELRDWLDTSPLSERDRELLRLTMSDHDAESIAQLQSTPLPRVRVQLTRAQTRARAMWAVA